MIQPSSILTPKQTEQKAKKWFIDKWRENDGWANTHEYARGGTSGSPDVHVLLGKEKPLLVPLEFKLAERLADRESSHYHETGRVGWYLKLHKVRPAQISWHRTFFKAGGFSTIIAAEWIDEHWEFYALPADDLRFWENGVVIGGLNQSDRAYQIWPSHSTLNWKLERFMRYRYNISTRVGEDRQVGVRVWWEEQAAIKAAKKGRKR